MATKAFQKIYTKITQITKATCSLKATGVGYDELASVDGKLAQVVPVSRTFLQRLWRAYRWRSDPRGT